MTTALLTLVFLAPAMVTAAALSKLIPEPTQFAPSVDSWSPAPTAVAQLPFGLFKRESNDGYTCGFVSASSERPVTCQNPTQTCATNTYFGIHGCCDPDSNAACTIATLCIASTAMSASCTDAACSSDAAIAKCTAGSAPACYEWHFVYEKMVMTQHGIPHVGHDDFQQQQQ
ncbi:hypothetical protein DDE83_007393 [Stemphylium lycopersici]|uniref:Uncharacterized protein n=1 Tax=Stemphylium lycopersici TaxID=183478 RepID=A0A364MW32_STELY|nr:hypothetical protein DDE83_007393 [Stemphylium lycopersici]